MKMKLNKNSILILLAAPVLLGSAVETPGADAAKAAAADTLSFAADTFAFAAIDTSLYVVKDTAVYLPAPLCDSSLVGKSIFDLLQGVELRQNVSIRTAMAEHIRLNAGRKISGYRIRIYFDNRQNARSESERIEKEFKTLFPEMQVYRSYANPYFKVTVGDFRTRSEALSVLSGIKSIYPSAFLVKENISYPPIDGENPVVLDTVTIVRPKTPAVSSGTGVSSL